MGSVLDGYQASLAACGQLEMLPLPTLDLQLGQQGQQLQCRKLQLVGALPRTALHSMAILWPKP